MNSATASLFSDTPHALLALDTETSSLFDRERYFAADGQARLAACGMIWASPGYAWMREQLFYVKPDGWSMHPEATAVNGLTDDFLSEHGMPIRDVLGEFAIAMRENRAVICFNAAFDLKVMRAEAVRAGVEDWFGRVPYICTMKKSTGVVKARKEDGGFKSPTLDEAMRHFKLSRAGAHTALGDAMDALQLARFLSQIGMNMVPEFQKRRPKDETP